jgi:hypothetical protein
VGAVARHTSHGCLDARLRVPGAFYIRVARRLAQTVKLHRSQAWRLQLFLRRGGIRMRHSSARFDARRLAERAFDARNFGFRRARSRRSGRLGWLALGAGLATLGLALFEPTRGAARRAALREKTSSGLRRVREGTRGRLSDARARARGALHELRARFEEGEVSDSVLEERVRAKMGRAVSHPGALRVSAAQGCVEISGPVLADEAGELIDSIRGVRGVKDVVDRLDVHESAGNEPALQGAASRPSL